MLRSADQQTDQTGTGELPKPRQDQKASLFVQSVSSDPFNVTNRDTTATFYDEDYFSYSPLRNHPPPPPSPLPHSYIPPFHPDTMFTPTLPGWSSLTLAPLVEAPPPPSPMPPSPKTASFHHAGPTSRCPHSRMTVRT